MLMSLRIIKERFYTITHIVGLWYHESSLPHAQLVDTLLTNIFMLASLPITGHMSNIESLYCRTSATCVLATGREGEHNTTQKGWEHMHIILHNHLAHCIPTHTISNALQPLVVWTQHQSQHVLCLLRVKNCCK